MSKALFVIGTGTDVGKTYVAGLLVKKLKEYGESAGYYKAAMSGNLRGKDGKLIPGDALFVKNMSQITQSLESMCPYVYEQAVSPHLASRLEGNPVSLPVVKDGFAKVCENAEYVTLEGSGGILCPINKDEEELWLIDIMRATHTGCVMVADAGLGTINNVGLTAFYLKQKGIPLKGIIFNHFKPGDVMQEDNLRMCEELTGVKVLACVQDNSENIVIEKEILQNLYGEVEE
ncbi:dethiobiotin synthetase [Lachnospiraceae bacterium XBB1006]|nr:dethiobiotin synthetase [Lachnospiraceae bacterium XBB1006]